MLVNRKDFLDSLRKFSAVVESPSGTARFDHPDCVHFYNGKMFAYSYNLSLLAVSSSPLEDIQCSVHFCELIGILGKMSTTDIDVSIEDGHFLIKAGKAKCGIRIYDIADSGPHEVINACESVERVPVFPSLFNALQNAVFCTSKNEWNELFNLHVSGDVRACNGSTAVILDLPDGETVPPECLIPSSCVSALSKYNFTHMGVSDSYYVFFDADGLMFCVRKNEHSDFPDFSVFLKKALEGVQFVFPREIGDIVRKVTIFANKDKTDYDRILQPVLISLKPNRITCKGTGDYGWYEEVVQTEYDGENMEFLVDANTMLNMLPGIEEARYGNNMVYSKGKDFQYIFMCMIKQGCQ